MTFASPKNTCAMGSPQENSVIGFPRVSIWRPSDMESIVMTTELCCIFWSRSNFDCHKGTWVINMKNVLPIKTILFDILDFWCQLEEIRFVKTLSKRRMLVSFMKILACWLLHCLIKFNKICWEKRPAKPRPNLWTSFCRCDLKNSQPHLNVSYSSCWGNSLINTLKLKK